MHGLGLDYASLQKINPRLVMTSISNFGQTGPYRDYKATELILFAMGLHMYHEGEPDREPLRFPGYKAQYLAGTHAATATMGAFFGVKNTGKGQHIDVSIMECMTAPPEGAAWLMAEAFSGLNIKRAGYRREGAYPLNAYPCKDGYVFVYGTVTFFWPRIAAWMGMPELLDDPRFATPVERREHQSDFDAIFLPWIMEQTQQEAFHSGQAHRLPVTPVNTMDKVIEDAQFKARKSFTEIEHPVTGKAVYPNIPFKLPETPSQPQQPAPMLGQYNSEIYCEQLGYSKQDLIRMRETGVI